MLDQQLPSPGIPAAGRRIFIVCPARTRTGGPEAQHQLGRALLDLGHDVSIAYVDAARPGAVADGALVALDGDDLMPEAYAGYRVPRVSAVPDDPDAIVIVPEIWIDLLGSFRVAHRCLWWLSIDAALPGVERNGGFEALRQKGWTHLAQSYYAIDYLASHGIPSLPVFDYTVIAPPPEGPPARRLNRILYPARGAWFAGWLRKVTPWLAWQEIKGFTPDQVRELFLTSKAYVDFGHHPGKDRMPREAARLGCCVITGLRGSAANDRDVPIPRRYKFVDVRSRSTIPILLALHRILLRFAASARDFDGYRGIIAGERQEFEAQVASAFGYALQPAVAPAR